MNPFTKPEYLMTVMDRAVVAFTVIATYCLVFGMVALFVTWTGRGRK